MTICIEAFSTRGCSKCAGARQALKQVAEEVADRGVVWRELDVIEHLERAVELGVLSPPSLAIDGDLVFPALPTPERLREELLRRLRSAQGASSPSASVKA